MTNKTHKAAIPNPMLERFTVLVGEWETIGHHPYFPDITLHGRTSFQWIENGAFLMMRSENVEGKIPSGIAIFGSDDAQGKYSMLYLDERKVSRFYEVSFQERILKWWRDDPAFSQQLTFNISDDGNTIVGEGQMRRDGKAWEKDLQLTYKRIS